MLRSGQDGAKFGTQAKLGSSTQSKPRENYAKFASALESSCTPRRAQKENEPAGSGLDSQRRSSGPSSDSVTFDAALASGRFSSQLVSLSLVSTLVPSLAHSASEADAEEKF